MVNKQRAFKTYKISYLSYCLRSKCSTISWYNIPFRHARVIPVPQWLRTVHFIFCTFKQHILSAAHCMESFLYFMLHSVSVLSVLQCVSIWHQLTRFICPCAHCARWVKSVSDSTVELWVGLLSVKVVIPVWSLNTAALSDGCDFHDNYRIVKFHIHYRSETPIRDVTMGFSTNGSKRFSQYSSLPLCELFRQVKMQNSFGVPYFIMCYTAFVHDVVHLSVLFW